MKKATMEYYEVSPASQRVVWLNGQHMKMTAGLTALGFALGCTYDSRQPQVVWQPGCSVKLDRSKVQRIKGFTSSLHPGSCPSALTTSVQMGTYLPFYVENFNTVNQCVLQLEGLWRVHKDNAQNENESEHRNKIWIVRIDVTDTHDLQLQPAPQDIFSDRSLLAPDFFTTRHGSKPPRLSPAKSRGKSSQQKKAPSYKINSSRRKSHKRSFLTQVTAAKMVQQALSQCQHNLHTANAAGPREDCSPERSASIGPKPVFRAQNLRSIHNNKEAETRDWCHLKNKNRNNPETKNTNLVEDDNWSDADNESWSEVKSDTYNDIGENGSRSKDKSWGNLGQAWKCPAEKIDLSYNINNGGHDNNSSIIDTDSERRNLGLMNANCIEVESEYVDQHLSYNKTLEHSTQQAEDSHGSPTKTSVIAKSDRVSAKTSAPNTSTENDPQEPHEISHTNSIHATPAVAQTVKVSDSALRSHQLQYDGPTAFDQASVKNKSTNSAHSQCSIASSEIKKTTSSRAGLSPEPAFRDTEQPCERMLVDLSKHEVVGTWLYNSDEDDDYDSDESIHKKEEAFFRVDVTGLLHELYQVRQREQSPNVSLSRTSASKEPSHVQMVMGNSSSSNEDPMNRKTDINNEETDGSPETELQSYYNINGHFGDDIPATNEPVFDDRVEEAVRGHYFKNEKSGECSVSHKSKCWSTSSNNDTLKTDIRSVDSKGHNPETVQTPSQQTSNNKVDKCYKNSIQNTTLGQAEIRRTDADENKENTCVSTSSQSIEKINLKNIVNQYEALTYNNPKRRERPAPDTVPAGSRKGIFSARSVDTTSKTVQQARELALLKRSIANVDIISEDNRLPSPKQRSSQNAITRVTSIQLLSTCSSDDHTERNKNRPADALHSPPQSGQTPVGNRTLPNQLSTDKKFKRSEEKVQAGQLENSNFAPSGTDSLHYSPQEVSSFKSMAVQLSNQKAQCVMTRPNLSSLSSKRKIVKKCKTNSSSKSIDEMHDIEEKARSVLLTSLGLAHHISPQCSASVSLHSQSMSSLLMHEFQDDSQNGKLESSVSLGETTQRIDQSDRRSPELKQSVLTIKKQFSKNREVRRLSCYQEKETEKNNKSMPISEITVEIERVQQGAATETAEDKYDINFIDESRAKNMSTHKHGTDEATGQYYQTEMTSNHEHGNGDQRHHRQKSNTSPEGNQGNEHALTAGSTLGSRPVPESALVVFRLQPSTPHQAWQFKKAILKVHYRNEAKNSEDKTSDKDWKARSGLKRNANLLRQRRVASSIQQ